MGYVYLIHFERKYKHAGHYLGFCSKSVTARMKRHLAGRGARLLQVIQENGIEWELVRTWKGGRDFERKLKKGKRSPKLCPVCNPNIKPQCRRPRTRPLTAA